MTNIYFVRHAQPDYSITDDILRPLTEKGLSDTKLVTEVLKIRNIEVIYSSPFKRAFDTIRDFAERIGLEIKIIEDFRERKIHNEWIVDFRDFSRRQWEDFDYKLENGESLREVQKRNIAALYDILKKNMGGNIAVGSHGTALSTIINYFRSEFGYEDFLAIKDRMPYIMCFKFEGMEFASMEEIAI